MRWLVALLLVAGLAGCVDDDRPVENAPTVVPVWISGPGSHPAFGLPVRADLPDAGQAPEGWPQYWVKPPAAALPNSIEALALQGAVNEVHSGSGITIFGSLAFVASWQTPDLWAVDISNPDDPRVIGHFDETTAGDLEAIAFPPTTEHSTGRLILTASTRQTDIRVIDVTDPTNMVLINSITTRCGNHNHQVIPGTPYIVNAASSGEGGCNDIWDLSDPENPVEAGDLANNYGCHAVDFYINADEDKFLGFCAGIQVTQVLDISDPLAPTVLGTAPFPVLMQDVGISGSAALAGFSHLAMGNHDGTVMIMGDETGGGAAPGCDAHAYEPTTGTSVTGPLGNLYFYDVSDPTNPVLHGAVSPSAWEQNGSCTAHFGNVIEDRNQLVMAFYTAGVALVDFTDLDNPYIQDLSGRREGEAPCTLCGVWDAQYYQGRVWTGDISYGMEVMTLV